MKDSFKGLGIYAVIIVFVLLMFMFNGFNFGLNSPIRMTDAELTQNLEDGKVERVEITPIKVGDASMGDATVLLSDDTTVYTVYVSNIESFRQKMQESYASVPLVVSTVEPDSIWGEIIPVVLLVGGMCLFLFLVINRMQSGGSGGGNKMMNFGRSRAHMIDKSENPIRFANVAGLEEEKEEMKEVVDFLKSPQRFTELGARIPKGVLM